MGNILHVAVFEELVCKYSSIILSFEVEIVKKRKEALKEEKELGRIQAKRYLDFLDIILLARVCYVISENQTFSL